MKSTISGFLPYFCGMKFFICALFLYCTVQKNFAQHIVPVGEVTFLDTIPGQLTHSTSCRACGIPDYCLFVLLPYTPKAPFLSRGYNEVCISPDTPGVYSDVITAHYYDLGPQGCCKNFAYCGQFDSNTFAFSAKAYYKNMTLLSATSPVVFYYDSSTNNVYKDAVVDLHIVNKNSDSIKFTDWVIVKDSSNTILLHSLKILDGLSFHGNVDTTYPWLHLMTWRNVASNLQHYSIIIRTIAHVGNKDSLCILNLDAIFMTKSNSYVSQKKIKSDFFIQPNPSIGLLTLSCALQNPSILHLHIFDELGRDVMTVFDGIMNQTQKEFSVKLSPGLYYIGMQTPEGVVTKKAVVEYPVH